MSDNDISITISANPQQAVQSIELVNKEAKKLSETEKQVNQSAMSDTSNTVNQVLSVGRAARREFEQTGTAVGGISTGIKTAATEASKISGAFGKSIPVIGQLGSAIAGALTGPIGAISAAIGLAIAGIQRLIADAEARVERLKLSAAAKTGSAYDALMKGRADYAAQLQVLAQVREINKLAQGSALSADELAGFRQLASQIGIAERDVGARGIRSGKIAEAERALKQQRRFYSDQEYQNYITEFTAQLRTAVIDAEGLNSETKNSLLKGSIQDTVDAITGRARNGSGWTLGEFRAYQELYGIVKQFNDVRSSYNLDAMLGRSQTELNTAAVDAIRNRYAKDAAKAAAGSGASGAPAGSLAAANEQAKREASGQKLLQGIEREIEIQRLINDGKQREAFILQNRLSIEAAYGRELYAAEYADLERRAGLLYDLRHPEEPDLAPEPGAVETPERTRARQVYVPLDRLQRIGANAARAVTTPEKLVLDKSLSVQEQIRNILAGIVTSNAGASENVMRF